MLLVVRGPPVAEIAVGIELAAYVVEAVREFVADHDADGAKVHGVVGSVVIERRLQNSSGECDVVLIWVVGGVHGHWRIRPISLIERLADLVEPALDVVLVRALRVAQRIAAHDLERRVITPLVGMADAVGDRLQFPERLGFGVRAHPEQGFDVFAQRRFNIPDHGQCALLAFGTESLLHVNLADQLAQVTVRVAHAALPTRTQLLGPRQSLAEEIEVFVHERRRQHRRVRMHRVPAQIRLPIVERVRA